MLICASKDLHRFSIHQETDNDRGFHTFCWQELHSSTAEVDALPTSLPKVPDMKWLARYSL